MREELVKVFGENALTPYKFDECSWAVSNRDKVWRVTYKDNSYSASRHKINIIANSLEALKTKIDLL